MVDLMYISWRQWENGAGSHGRRWLRPAALRSPKAVMNAKTVVRQEVQRTSPWGRRRYYSGAAQLQLPY